MRFGRKAVVAAAAALAGCGGDGQPDDAGRAAAPAPQRIVSLSPTATETLFAIGAGEQVVAVDDQSDHPPDAPRTRLSGLEPSVEAVAERRPDLVILTELVPRDVVGGLRRIGVRVHIQPAPETLADAYRQIHELGAISGHREAAARVAGAMRDRIESTIASVPKTGRPLRVFHELGPDPDLYAASSDTFIGHIYARMGMRNVADPAARSTDAPYPQLSPEALVAFDPDLVVVADTECCGQAVEAVKRRSGWDEVTAVRNGGVIAVDADVASRWGPRLPEFVEDVAAAVRSR